MTSAFSWQNSVRLCPASICQGQICLLLQVFLDFLLLHSSHQELTASNFNITSFLTIFSGYISSNLLSFTSHGSRWCCYNCCIYFFHFLVFLKSLSFLITCNVRGNNSNIHSLFFLLYSFYQFWHWWLIVNSSWINFRLCGILIFEFLNLNFEIVNS